MGREVDMIFEITGEPKSLARPRLWKDKVYDSQAAEKRIDRLKLLEQRKTLDQQERALLDSGCDVVVTLLFYHATPRSFNRSQVNAIEQGLTRDVKGQSLLPHKKDIDNEIKYVFDVGNGLLWDDDRQITEVHAVKLYTNNAPRTIIIIESINAQMLSNA